MRGLVLEGGGAKGAYHIGVFKAMREEGKALFDGFAGTSIGAINAAMLAAGDWEKTVSMWENLRIEEIAGVDADTYRLMLMKRRITRDNLNDVGRLASALGSLGAAADRVKKYFEDFIDEDAVRSSPADFGLVTYSLPDFKPVYLMKEDIPEGKLTEYIMASAAYPAFGFEKIDGIENRWFVDGGVYDNLPVNMLVERNYDSVCAIRTNVKKFLPYRKVEAGRAEIEYYVPSEKLDFAMDFSGENIARYIEMGYYDAIRRLRGLDGTAYCVVPLSETDFRVFTDVLDNGVLAGIVRGARLKPHRSKDANLEDFFDILREHLSLRPEVPDSKVFEAFLETIAGAAGIDRFAVYTLPELYGLTVRKGREALSGKENGLSQDSLRKGGARNGLRQIFLSLCGGETER